MKKIIIAILLLCAAVGAQSLLALQYPLGLPDVAHTGSSTAMGGSGVAVVEENFGAALNPANAAIGKRSSFTSLVTFEMTSINDDGKSSSASKYSPRLISLVLPIGGIGNVGLSMQRRYDANLNYYTSNTTTSAVQDAGTTTHENTIELQNTGGLTAWQAGWGYRFGNGLSFGVAYERLFYNHDSRNTFESIFTYDISDNRAATSFRTTMQETTKSGFAADGLRLGMQVPVTDAVTVGAAGEYTFKSKNGTVEYEYRRNDHDAGTSTVVNVDPKRKFEILMPPSVTVGAAYRHDERLLVALDVQSVFWGRYENDEPELFGTSGNLQQTFGVSAGGRFIPAVSRLSAKYWEQVLYSAGARYGMLPLEGAHEIGFSLGAGLPIPNDGGVVDVILEYGRRFDTKRYDNYSENTLKFHLGINGGRNWFQGNTQTR